MSSFHDTLYRLDGIHGNSFVTNPLPRIGVFSETLPGNGRLFSLHYSGFQTSYHNMLVPSDCLLARYYVKSVH
jgi:hypothetical protein